MTGPHKNFNLQQHFYQYLQEPRNLSMTMVIETFCIYYAFPAGTTSWETLTSPEKNTAIPAA